MVGIGSGSWASGIIQRQRQRAQQRPQGYRTGDSAGQLAWDWDKMREQDRADANEYYQQARAMAKEQAQMWSDQNRAAMEAASGFRRQESELGHKQGLETQAKQFEQDRWAKEKGIEQERYMQDRAAEISSASTRSARNAAYKLYKNI